ncbi:MAG: molybdenum cofactor biosynthesis protein MoaE [Cryomorphaceae bacterium]|nr:molybdenum cofactor biosynthesis protein MoaE [Cryomorphaceae bacterium]
MSIQIVSSEIDVEACRKSAAADAAGAVVVFVGAVRDNTKGREVVRLEYEAYVPMAIKVLGQICERAESMFGLLKITVHHRIGILNVGDTAVAIAVSAPHRKAAFDGCQFIIDELKKDVPIWKKECFTDGEAWLTDRP